MEKPEEYKTYCLDRNIDPESLWGLSILDGWNARQPEIDTLKDKANELALSCALAISTAKNLEAERDALKSEVKRLQMNADNSECSTLPGVEDWFLDAMKGSQP